MISVCFRASSWTWTATALWRRVWWRKAKRCSSSSPPTNQVPSLFLPHTHTRVDTHSNTHTGGHIVATTPFHSLLIFGLTERPSEGRTHMNVAPKERRREIKIKKRDGEIEEEEEEREEEEPAGWKWLTGGEVSQSYFRFSQNICSRTERERERERGRSQCGWRCIFPFCNLMEIFRFGL